MPFLKSKKNAKFFSPLGAAAALALVAILQQPNGAQAAFGDFVDPTFNCPATTTCPQVCVANYEECPSSMRCPGSLIPCADGSCRELFCDSSLVSPCTKDCAPVACPKLITTYDVCLRDFSPWYEKDCTSSGSETGGDEVRRLEDIDGEDVPSWTDPAFVWVYSWLIVTTFAIVAWNWFK